LFSARHSKGLVRVPFTVQGQERTHPAELIGETEQLREGFEIVNKNPSLSLLSRLAMGRPTAASQYYP